MSGRAMRWALAGLGAGLCAALGATATSHGPAHDGPVVQTVAAQARWARPACEALRRSSAAAIAVIVHERIRALGAQLAAEPQASPLDRTLLGLEGAMLECLLAGDHLSGASFDDAPEGASAGIEWARPGVIAACTYLLVHEGCAIGIRVQRADAAPVFEVWEALLEEQGSLAPGTGSVPAGSDIAPASTSDLDVAPKAIEFVDRVPGSECCWEVVVSSRQAQRITVVPPEGTERVQCWPLLRGDVGRCWLVRGRTVAPGPGRVRAGVCQVQTWPDGQRRDVHVKCATASALRPSDDGVHCTRDREGWHGKLDFEWMRPDAMPQISVAVQDVSGIRATWECIQVAPERFRLLLRCADDGTRRAPACKLLLQVPGEDVRQAIRVALP